jgi:uncharacterized phage protein (TIGR02218 family)
VSAGLEARLAAGAARVARAWSVRRRDGRVLGFTDHDEDLVFDGVLFRAMTGWSARAVQQTTGLAVDNTETVGALGGEAIEEGDIAAGRYDGAEVVAWIVDWVDPAERRVIFRGTMGEVVRAGAAFKAELRGLSEALNLPTGRVYQRRCPAVLGDDACRVDLSLSAFSAELRVLAVSEARIFVLEPAVAFADGWFEAGALRVLGGVASGLSGVIRSDRSGPSGREIELWQGLGAAVVVGDRVRIAAGCDKQPITCRNKFSNFINYRGFPHVPPEDWLLAYPVEGGRHDGGSRA